MSINHKYFDLKKLRKDQDLSQNELSLLISVSRTRLSRIENYKERLSTSQLNELFKKFESASDYKIVKQEKSTIELKKKILELESQIDIANQLAELNKQLIQSKDDQIKLLKSKLNHPISNEKEIINVSKLNSKGKFINWDLISIPSDKYFEIVPGIFDRLITHPKHFIEAWEKVYADAVNKIDFDRYTVILNKSKNNAIFQCHYHKEPEIIICVKGKILENLTRTTISSGESIEFESMEVHELTILLDSFLIILIEKVS